jgi:hypothetical protein
MQRACFTRIKAQENQPLLGEFDGAKASKDDGDVGLGWGRKWNW